MPVNIRSERDLKALKKDELIRLVIDYQNSPSSCRPSGTPNSSSRGRSSLGQVTSSPAQILDTSNLKEIIKTAVAEAVRELKSELKNDYTTLVLETEKKFATELSNLRQEVESLRAKLDTTFRNAEHEFLRDLRETEDRKQNILIFGVPECDHSSPSVRKDSDISKVMTLARELGVNQLLFKNIFRLGKPSDRPRPIKLIGLPSHQRETLLRSASQLRSTSDFQRVYIRADLSLKEREYERKLRDEVNRRRSAGEKVFLRGGRIVSFSQNERRD